MGMHFTQLAARFTLWRWKKPRHPVSGSDYPGVLVQRELAFPGFKIGDIIVPLPAVALDVARLAIYVRPAVCARAR
jgi:hypothetical protein